MNSSENTLPAISPPCPEIVESGSNLRILRFNTLQIGITDDINNWRQTTPYALGSEHHHVSFIPNPDAKDSEILGIYIEAQYPSPLNPPIWDPSCGGANYDHRIKFDKPKLSVGVIGKYNRDRLGALAISDPVFLGIAARVQHKDQTAHTDREMLRLDRDFGQLAFGDLPTTRELKTCNLEGLLPGYNTYADWFTRNEKADAILAELGIPRDDKIPSWEYEGIIRHTYCKGVTVEKPGITEEDIHEFAPGYGQVVAGFLTSKSGHKKAVFDALSAFIRDDEMVSTNAETRDALLSAALQEIEHLAQPLLSTPNHRKVTGVRHQAGLLSSAQKLLAP